LLACLRRLAGLAAVLARLADERVVLVLVHQELIIIGHRGRGGGSRLAARRGNKEGKCWAAWKAGRETDTCMETIPYRRWVIINALPSEPEA